LKDRAGTGDGTKQVIERGDILLAEDTTAAGTAGG